MTVETRVIIDANASNAIKEIGKLDDAAADADKSIAELDGQTVDVDTDPAVDSFRAAVDAAADAIQQAEKLDAEKVAVKVDFDVDTDRLDTVKKSADGVESSGRAASTAIGGIGNTISELPGIGALGPMAESMGQLSEGALEGEVGIGELVTTAGGLAAVSVVASQIAAGFERAAAAKAFRKEQVEDYTAALKDASSNLDAIATKLQEQGGVFVDLFADGKPEDVTDAVNQVGLSVADFTKLVEAGRPAIDKWANEMRDSGHDGDDLKLTVAALKVETDAYTKATDAAEQSTRFFGEQTDATAGKATASADEIRGFTAALEGVPPEKKTEILTLVDQGQLDVAEKQLDDLSKPRDVAFRAFLANPSFTSLLAVGAKSVTQTQRLTGVRE